MLGVIDTEQDNRLIFQGRHKDHGATWNMARRGAVPTLCDHSFQGFRVFQWQVSTCFCKYPGKSPFQASFRLRLVSDTDSISETGMYANDLEEQPQANLMVIGVYAGNRVD